MKANVIDLLKTNGWTEDGKTREETVRIPTMKSPLYGKSGGELATFGGRLRFSKGERKVTVGEKTTFFYEHNGSDNINSVYLKTKDIEEIKKHV